MAQLIHTANYDRRMHGVVQLLRLYEKSCDIPDSALPDTQLSAPLSTAEARGAQHALDVMMSWAAQIEASAQHLSDDPACAVLCTPRVLAVGRAMFAHDLARMQQLGFCS
ncbi:hypothetical protein CDO87_03555 [Sagittula sp. P11]|uniref:hypothetical protein n=1 Tax=Sagittula sp. P11 TaxID=2009329 RepID=UPI000C2D30C9|nr:hypothetical protein [Sagittula sp. P11]AUC52320.1 hypothetical protein CDO87_03555 [Sagittula sp. P11]